MVITADEFDRQLRADNIPQLLCFFGEERYLLQRAVSALRNSIFSGGQDDFNDDRFDGKSCQAQQVIDAARTLPVFSSRRLVTIKDAHLIPSGESEQLIPYLKEPVPETCLLLIADKIDSRRKFYQQFKKSGVLVEFKALAEKALPAHVKSILDSQDIAISADALNLFTSMVGEGLQEVHTELDKLVTYIGDRRLVDIKDVQAVVSRGRAENIFELGNAVGRGDVTGALELIIHLTAGGEPPLRILALLVRHFRQLWTIRELEAQKRSRKEMASIARVPFFVVEGLVKQSGRFSRKDFIRFHELFLETDLAMKSSGADADALLESLVLCLVEKKDHRQPV